MFLPFFFEFIPPLDKVVTKIGINDTTCKTGANSKDKGIEKIKMEVNNNSGHAHFEKCRAKQ
jgi:hypothetical protein